MCNYYSLSDSLKFLLQLFHAVSDKIVQMLITKSKISTRIVFHFWSAFYLNKRIFTNLDAGITL